MEDRLKMVKHKAWATTSVMPKLERSMTTEGQMKATFRVSLTVSQAGENSQSNAPNIPLYPISRPDLQKKSQNKNSTVGTQIHY